MIWNGISPKALKDDGAVTGISLVVIIVGQVTFEPALHPMYGVPDITFFLTGAISLLSLRHFSSIHVFPPPTTIAGASMIALTGSLK